MIINISLNITFDGSCLCYTNFHFVVCFKLPLIFRVFTLLGMVTCRQVRQPGNSTPEGLNKDITSIEGRVEVWANCIHQRRVAGATSHTLFAAEPKTCFMKWHNQMVNGNAISASFSSVWIEQYLRQSMMRQKASELHDLKVWAHCGIVKLNSHDVYSKTGYEPNGEVSGCHVTKREPLSPPRFKKHRQCRRHHHDLHHCQPHEQKT